MKTNLMTVMLASAAMFLGATAQAGNFVAKSPSGKLTLTVNSGSKLTWKVDLNGNQTVGTCRYAHRRKRLGTGRIGRKSSENKP